jgi:transcriptional regulator of acetoin/glycerol metabolism
MNDNILLLEAVQRLRTAEQEVDSAKENVANLLKVAASTQPVTALSRFTGIKRTTIYWMISKYSME